MTERFNHAKVPTWETLNDSERYWAGYVARKLDDSGFVRSWRYGHVACPVDYAPKLYHDLNEGDRWQAWLEECLFVALTHPEKVIAFRAFMQALKYIERVAAHANYHDAMAVAQFRIEGWL